MDCSKSSLPMWQKLKRFSALSRTARGQFLRAAALLPLIALSLRLRGFRKTQVFLERFIFLPLQETSVSDSERADLTSRMVRAAARRTLGRATCLEESLALWWLLARQGVGSDLRIGVRRNGESFEAHAWVDLGGTVLNEPDGAHLHYAAFDAALVSLPPETS